MNENHCWKLFPRGGCSFFEGRWGGEVSEDLGGFSTVGFACVGQGADGGWLAYPFKRGSVSEGGEVPRKGLWEAGALRDALCGGRDREGEARDE